MSYIYSVPLKNAVKCQLMAMVSPRSVLFSDGNQLFAASARKADDAVDPASDLFHGWGHVQASFKCQEIFALNVLAISETQLLSIVHRSSDRYYVSVVHLLPYLSGISAGQPGIEFRSSWTCELQSTPTFLHSFADTVYVACLDGKVYRYRVPEEVSDALTGIDSLLPSESVLSICVTADLSIFGCQNGTLDLFGKRKVVFRNDGTVDVQSGHLPVRRTVLLDGPITFVCEFSGSLLLASALTGVWNFQVGQESFEMHLLPESNVHDIPLCFAVSATVLFVGFYSGEVIGYRIVSETEKTGAKWEIGTKFSVREPVYGITCLDERSLAIQAMYTFSVFDLPANTQC
ncbi:putative mitochondrial protein [Andalucia godoyi]|uniref:Putative mitochondrial protein n=1 Tax=Andalucia godoyi TaxID=505711 RepID=A0A8K0F268_ANDGO|nr:putative mitochondrial protein [Andalucia godoyi]|eukprot:ANDGO_04038.mRNA.1 putative mitochondrial protein